MATMEISVDVRFSFLPIPKKVSFFSTLHLFKSFPCSSEGLPQQHMATQSMDLGNPLSCPSLPV